MILLIKSHENKALSAASIWLRQIPCRKINFLIIIAIFKALSLPHLWALVFLRTFYNITKNVNLPISSLINSITFFEKLALFNNKHFLENNLQVYSNLLYQIYSLCTFKAFFISKLAYIVIKSLSNIMFNL